MCFQVSETGDSARSSTPVCVPALPKLTVIESFRTRRAPEASMMRGLTLIGSTRWRPMKEAGRASTSGRPPPFAQGSGG